MKFVITMSATQEFDVESGDDVQVALDAVLDYYADDPGGFIYDVPSHKIDWSGYVAD